MTYFFDFDRTLFDTHSFKKKFGMFLSLEEPYLKHLDLRKYVYPDAALFLKAHAEDITIVTFGIRMFLLAKVTTALPDFPDTKIVYTTRGKGHIIKKLCEKNPPPFVFVDDMHFQLESVSKMCPEIKVIEMRRDDREPEGDVRWTVIRSFDELQKI